MAEINEYAKRIFEVLRNPNHLASLKYFEEWMRSKRFIINGNNLNALLRFKYNCYKMNGNENFNKETWDMIEEEGDAMEIMHSAFFFYKSREHFQFWEDLANQFDEDFTALVQNGVILPNQCYDPKKPFFIEIPIETISVRNGNNITVPSNTNTWGQKTFSFKTEEDIIAEKLFDNMEFKNNIKILV